VSPSGAPCNAVVRGHLESGADTTGALGQNFLAASEYGRLNVYGALSIIDTDLDGLSDSEELALGTDPLLADTDDDGLSDSEEVTWGTDPLDQDTDDDGFKDSMEVLAGYDPVNSTEFPVWGDVDDSGNVDVVDMLKATRAVLGLMSLTVAELARGNVAPLVGGVPDSRPDDEFTVADLLLITGKATGSISY